MSAKTPVRLHLLLLLPLVLLLSCSWSASLGPTETVMLPMRDGVHLATDYYLPPCKRGPFPVVLVRSVYGRPGKDIAPAFLERKIALVIQDTRGRGGSESQDMVFADDGWGEHQDGLDTVNWIREQKWCNGKVGTWGGSALGITQLLLAGTGVDMQAQSILVAASEFYGQLSYQGGVWRKSLVEGWLKAQKSEHVIDIWKAHPAYDAFWQENYNFVARAPHMTAPALHVSGWFDIFSQGSIDNFLARQHQGGDGARGNQLLVMGPWIHGVTQKVGEMTLKDNFNFDIAGLEKRLYDAWLLGKDAGLADEPCVHYYTLGDVDAADAPGNEWRTATTWPPLPTTTVPYYLSADGALPRDAAQRQEGTRDYAYDPANPVPTRGGQNLLLPAGPHDQRELSSRADVLTFVTPVLDAPVEATGRVAVELYVSSDAPDTDFTVKLVDIYPDGREMLLLDSIQRLKFRNGFEQAQPLAPGTVDKVTIDLWSISVIFNAGHRIGVQISSSNYPRFEVNPNSGDDFPTPENMRAAHNTVYMSAQYPSALLLPIPTGN